MHVVTRGDITSVLTLSGVVAPSEALPLEAPTEGSVQHLTSEGDAVSRGQTVAHVGDVAVTAPVDAVVARHLLPEGADARPGDAIVSLQPGRFEVVAPVDPVLLYRLYDEPERIVAKIDRGPAPFDCPLVSLGADPEQLRLGNPLDVPVQLRCEVPDNVRVFPGVRATVAVTTGSSRDTVVVPVVAVEGAADEGTVWVVDDASAAQRRRVSLGLTDGHRVEVLDGLDEGERILEVAPGFDDPAGAGGSDS